MRIEKIGIKNYKNIESAEIEFESGINILIGENANGKTNAVEAIYQFAYGKSFRSRNSADSISFGAERCDLSLDFVSDSMAKRSNMKIQLKKNKSDKDDKLKKFFCNGIQAKKVVEFIGNFRAVLFTPDHLGLVKGSPDARRKFIDMAISQIKPVYLSYLIDCNRVLIQRNHLIKQIKQSGENGEKLEQLGIWTKKLAKYAAVITRYRGEYAERLKEYVPGFYSGLSQGKEGIKFCYVSNINKYDKEFRGFHDFEACEQLYSEVFERGQKEELAAGTALYGCQRDDLQIEIDGKSAREFASQGQQRSAVLSLKLAEGDISKISHGEYPVFLLDDILSELDRSRQGFILKNLSGRQVVITCCNSELLSGAGMEIAKTIKVENGRFAEG
ncbi:MAG: DNA replication/repair protein RecF [Oscillospiraceae bacterium]|nr:DNA replication/repair protein RecF [Oscillospiraceae bacterium]